MLWVVDAAGSLTTFTEQVRVMKVQLIPNATSDAVTFQDTNSKDAIYLKARATEVAPAEVDFSGEGGRLINGLKCSAISTSAKAYVYLKAV